MFTTPCPACHSTRIGPELYLIERAFSAAATLLKEPSTHPSLVDISLVQCQDCTHVFNRNFDHALASRSYQNEHYTCKSILPGAMSQTLRKVRDLLDRSVEPSSSVLEIGCGDGALAQSFIGGQRRVYTIDPSYPARHLSTLPAQELLHIAEPFSSAHSAITGTVDLIIARHVLEHLPEPVEFLRTVLQFLAPTGHLYIELPNFSEILESGRFYDIFHDHVNYFHPNVLENLALGLGLRTVRSIQLFDRQHVGFIFTRSQLPLSPKLPVELLTTHAFDQMRRAKTGADAVMATHNRIAIWGAGAHGTSFVSGIAPAAMQRVVAVFDSDTKKHGLYLQGLRVPIIPPNRRAVHECDLIFIVSSLYELEIEDHLRELQYNGRVICGTRGMTVACLDSHQG